MTRQRGSMLQRDTVVEPPNNEPFLLKQVTNRLQICQGWGGRIEDPPFDFCMSRMERKPYPTPQGNFRIPTRASNCHYHLRMCCITAVEPSFGRKGTKKTKRNAVLPSASSWDVPRQWVWYSFAVNSHLKTKILYTMYTKLPKVYSKTVLGKVTLVDKFLAVWITA